MQDYKGYSLFNDIEDAALRDRNRAVVMANIVETNTRNKLITPRASALIMGYFACIPVEQRAHVQELFKTNLKERGYATKSNS